MGLYDLQASEARQRSFTPPERQRKIADEHVFTVCEANCRLGNNGACRRGTFRTRLKPVPVIHGGRDRVPRRADDDVVFFACFLSKNVRALAGFGSP